MVGLSCRHHTRNVLSLERPALWIAELVATLQRHRDCADMRKRPRAMANDSPEVNTFVWLQCPAVGPAHSLRLGVCNRVRRCIHRAVHESIRVAGSDLGYEQEFARERKGDRPAVSEG